MNLQPVKTHILCRFYNAPEQVIQTPEKQFGSDDKLRTRVEVMRVGPDVKICKEGDFLLLIPAPKVLGVNGGDDGLIDEAHVLGIVTDDTRPLTIVE